MRDKQEAILASGQMIMDSVRDVIVMSQVEVLQAMRNVMDPKELQMFDLALFCEGEAIKAQDANAHFAACLMGAAMNEALLAFMCLRFEVDVRSTAQFGYSTKKKEREFRQVIADWKLEQFIKLAEQLEWIPAHIVDEPFKDLLAEGFRELMPVTHPEMTNDEIEAGAISFHQSPGPAMLRMTQELRNAIHPGKWLKESKIFVPENFTQWCRVATRLSGEIRMCLLHLFTEREMMKASDKIRQAGEMIAKLPPEYRALFEAEIRSKLGI